MEEGANSIDNPVRVTIKDIGDGKVASNTVVVFQARVESVRSLGKIVFIRFRQEELSTIQVVVPLMQEHKKPFQLHSFWDVEGVVVEVAQATAAKNEEGEPSAAEHPNSKTTKTGKLRDPHAITRFEIHSRCCTRSTEQYIDPANKLVLSLPRQQQCDTNDIPARNSCFANRDVLSIVFGYLNSMDDILAVSATCRYWNKCVLPTISSWIWY
jgi:hypothetical protein